MQFLPRKFLNQLQNQLFFFLCFSRYFGPVNFTDDGWCPDSASRAAYFSKRGSYATVPNVNITNCDFTIAFWLKSAAENGSIIAIWSLSGKPVYVVIKESTLLIQSVYKTWEEANFNSKEWTHIAITCEQSQIMFFVNGRERKLKKQWNQNFFLSPDTYQPYYFVGNKPADNPLITQPFVGAVMDLYLIQEVLSLEQISDMYRGKISSFGVSIK